MAEDAKQYALDKHREWQGKIEVVTRAPITTPEELAVAYTPGVAEPCLKISENVDDSYTYTRRAASRSSAASRRPATSPSSMTTSTAPPS